MRRNLRTVALTTLSLVGAALAGAALAQQGAPRLPPGFEAYLPAAAVGAGIPPPAAPGSAIDKADRARFKTTRALAGTQRWTLATTDGGRGVLKGFACAAGVELSADNAPALVKLLTRLRTDAINLTRAGGANGPERPFLRDKGPVCVAADSVKPAREHPSLQAAWGWGLGLLLSEALPQRNTALMARGRALGDSALVCGTSSASSVAAGRDAGAALIATLHADPAFAADFAEAKRQINDARGPAPVGCDAESAVLATPIP